MGYDCNLIVNHNTIICKQFTIKHCYSLQISQSGLQLQAYIFKPALSTIVRVKVLLALYVQKNTPIYLHQHPENTPIFLHENLFTASYNDKNGIYPECFLFSRAIKKLY